MKITILVKFLCIIIILMLLTNIILTTNIYATFNPDDWKPKDLSGVDKFNDKGNVIIGGIQVVGSIISVIVLVGLGIKYMYGSLEQKAEYKKTMLPYIIGAVLLFAGSQLVSAIFTWAQSLNN